MKTKKTAGRIALDILSIFFAVVFLAPVIWALFVSLQHEGKQISSIVSWFTPPYTISNYSDIIKNSSVPLWFMNSLFIAVIVTVATVLVTGMAAYALALIPFKGSQLFMIYVLIGMMVPGEATIVPLFITVKDLKLIDLMGKDGEAFLPVTALSELAGRFPYEFVCDIGKRVPRVYYQDGKIVEIVDELVK